MIMFLISLFNLILVDCFSQGIDTATPPVEFFTKKQNPHFSTDQDYISKSVKIYKLTGSIMGDEILLTPSSINSGGVDCDVKKNNLYPKTFQESIKKISRPFEHLQCQAVKKVKESKELSSEVCSNLASCLEIKAEKHADRIDAIIKNAKAKISEEVIGVAARDVIAQMADIDLLKESFIKKYGEGELPKSCVGFEVFEVPESHRDTCQLKSIDKGYEMGQMLCKIPEIGCEKDYLAFIKNKKTEDYKETGLMGAYLKKLSKKRADENANKDSDHKLIIAEILLLDELSDEVKMQKIISYLKENKFYLDPFMSAIQKNFAEGNKVKNEQNTNALMSVIKESRSRGKDKILEILNDYYKHQAVSQLEFRCKESSSIGGLCNLADEAMRNAEVPIHKDQLKKLLVMETGTMINNDNDIEELARNVGRCNIFSLASGDDNYTTVREKLAQGLDLFFPIINRYGHQDYSVKTNNSLTSKSVIDFTPDGKILIKDKASVLVENSKREIFVREYTSKFARSEPIASEFSSEKNQVFKNTIDSSPPVVVDKVKKVEVVEEVKSKNTESINTDFASNFNKKNIQPSQFTPTNQNSISSDNNRAQVTSEVDSSSVKTNENSPRNYAELVSKIKTLEDQLENNKAKKTNDLSGSVANKNSDTIPSQQESDLIKELKNTKEALAQMNESNEESEDRSSKKSKKKNQSTNEKLVSREDSDEAGRREVSSSTTREINETKPFNPSVEVSPSKSSTSSSDSKVSSISSASSGVKTDLGVANNSGITLDAANSTSSRDSFAGIVLNKVDSRVGIMETIKSLIQKNAGTQFYIEENGIVKQVILDVVDGKIQFDADGKPAFKIIEMGKIDELKSAPKAKTNSPIEKSTADLKREDEKQVNPSIRYRELKELINKANKSKP